MLIMADSIKFKPLQGTDNFRTWKNDIKSLLLSKSLWEEFIVEDVVQPTAYEDEPDYLFQACLKSYNKDCQKTMGLLLSSVLTELRPLIQDLRDPKAAFAKLEEALQMTGLAKYLVLHVKLFNV